MTANRAHELRREIRHTLAAGVPDDWTARELRRADRRLAAIARAEARETRTEARAERAAR